MNSARPAMIAVRVTWKGSRQTLQQRVRPSSIDQLLADDEWRAHRDLAGALCDQQRFAALSDLEIACAYVAGDSSLHDALYCELHLRQLTPWKICADPAIDVTP